MRPIDPDSDFSETGDWGNDSYWSRTLGDGLCLEATANPDSPVLERFFAGYDRAFVLPDEKEDLAGFKECLALNSRCRHAFGRTHCELVATVSDSDGVFLGGANFLTTALAQEGGGPSASVALNYIFVEPAVRRRGMLWKFIPLVRRLALESVGLSPSAGLPLPAVFIEQNDPLRMSKEECRRDTEHSGMDQIDRLAIWARVGARIVDFSYVQPALSKNRKPDAGLVYAAVDYPGYAVPSAVLHDHLESFFGISVLKGRALDEDATASAQLKELGERTAPVDLLDIRTALETLRRNPEAARQHTSLRSLARRAKG